MKVIITWRDNPNKTELYGVQVNSPELDIHGRPTHYNFQALDGTVEHTVNFEAIRRIVFMEDKPSGQTEER